MFERVCVSGDGVADLISLHNLLGGCRGNQVGVVIMSLYLHQYNEHACTCVKINVGYYHEQGGSRFVCVNLH